MFRAVPLVLALCPLAAPAASYFWSSGDFAPGTTAPAELQATDTLTIFAEMPPGAPKRFFDVSFSNGGTVHWLQDNLEGTSKATVSNSGVWDSSADTILSGSGTPLPTFTNTGTLRKSGGSGATTIGWSFTNNGGTIDAQAGTILFSSGQTTFGAGSRFQGAGAVEVGSDATFAGSFMADNLVLGSGVFEGVGAKLAGGVSSSGAVAWRAGDIQGSWEIGAGTTLTAATTGAKRHTGGTLVNLGTIGWDAGASLQAGNGASVVNRGLYEARTSTSISAFDTANRPSFVNHATGTVRAASDVVLTIGGIVLTSEGGAFDAAAGATILYSGGFARFNDGTRFTGAGSHTINNDARFVGTITTGNVELAGGTQTGGDGASAGSAALLQGPLAWTAGNLDGAWRIQAGSTVTAAGSGPKQQIGGSIVNDGTVIWNSGAAFQGGNGASFRNNALFEARSSMSLTFNGSGARNTFVNAADGIVRAANGATVSLSGIVLQSDGGRFDAEAGSAIAYATFSALFNDGTRFTGAGSHTLNADARFVGTITTANVTFAPGGTRTGGGTGGSRAIVQGTLEWNGGNLDGAWEIATGSRLTATGSVAKALVGGSLVNKGRIAWNADTPLQTSNGATITNDGVFDISTDVDLIRTSGAPVAFVNNGRFVKSAGTGTTSVAGLDFTNTGVLEVLNGTLALPNNFVNQGVLAGTGTFAYNGMLDNAGHIAPGASPGTLTLAGHLSQGDSAVLDIEIQSASVYDRLIVKGTTMLGGELALHCFADCRVAVGETLAILQSDGPLLGAFDAVTLNGFRLGAVDAPLYQNGQVLLRVTQTLLPVPEPRTYAMLLAGIGFVGWRAWRSRSRSVNP